MINTWVSIIGSKEGKKKGNGNFFCLGILLSMHTLFDAYLITNASLGSDNSFVTHGTITSKL